MNIKFIKLRGRPRKKILLTESQMLFLNLYKEIIIKGYRLKLLEQDDE